MMHRFDVPFLLTLVIFSPLTAQPANASEDDEVVFPLPD